jgi:DNA polymerase (family 10)
LAQKRGLRINEYGVYRGTRRVGGRDEREVAASVGLPVIPPELRENRGEIEAALAGSLPRLVETADIRGDLQSHTTDSDGRDTLAEMAHAAEALGYQYLAVTDHTPAVRVAGGLDRAGFRRQMRRIDRLNASLKSLTVLKGAEVDIHADGSLDLDDATLAALDIVVVSIHGVFDLGEREQTAVVPVTLRHPAVDILADRAGDRRREPIRLTENEAAAADHGALLEVNGQPDRLDLDDVAAGVAAPRAARGLDHAHAAGSSIVRWGVDQARRGGARREDGPTPAVAGQFNEHRSR